MKKRLLSLVLSLAMVITMLAPVASAAPKVEEPLTHHGLQGEYYLVQDTSGYPFTTLKGIYVDSDIAFSDTENMLSKRTGASDWAGARLDRPLSGSDHRRIYLLFLFGQRLPVYI